MLLPHVLIEQESLEEAFIYNKPRVSFLWPRHLFAKPQ